MIIDKHNGNNTSAPLMARTVKRLQEFGTDGLLTYKQEGTVET